MPRQPSAFVGAALRPVANELRERVLREYPDLAYACVRLARELKTAAVDRATRWGPRSRQKLRALAHDRSLKLHVGCGPVRLPSWVNVDATPNADFRLDLRRTLPFATGSVSLIFCEHFADYLSYPHGVRSFLRECYRVLAPDGRMRLIVHDLQKAARAYIDNDERYAGKVFGEAPSALHINRLYTVGGSHSFIYDMPLIERLLHEAGFEGVYPSAFRKSAISELNLDVDQEARVMQSLYVEASPSRAEG